MLNAVKRELMGLCVASTAIGQSYIRFGRNIFDYEWDALIILDACRVDALRSVADEYPFINTVQPVWSIGSTSKEWLENTFVEANRPEIEAATYITANSFARIFQGETLDRLDYIIEPGSRIASNPFIQSLIKDDLLHADDFLYYESLWDRLISSLDHAEIRPDIVTDRAITAGRDRDQSRLLVHYMQPHAPFLGGDGALTEAHREPFSYLKDGGDRDHVWDLYLENLRYVLDHVELLISNLDAEKVVITADHGELFGEWGIHSHGVGIPHPTLRKVPWVVTHAEDSGEYTPEDYDLEERASEEEIMSRLNDLGYVE